MSTEKLLLDIQDLKIHFHTKSYLLKVVDGINYNINRGETLGVVGESGCGKSITALSIMQLLPQPQGKIASGKIHYYDNKGNKIDITSLSTHSSKMRNLRGKEIAMIFQDPMTSLNPVYSVGDQIIEAMRLHQDVNYRQAKEHAIELLARVGIPAPAKRVNDYPHEFSGGMRQRVMIAMALSCHPSLLIADEPTTALDVTIQAQILALMKDLQEDLGMSIQFITHDLGVIGEMADRVIVMYCGKIVEKAKTDDLFDNPLHPYTQGLLKSIPRIGDRRRLTPIDGSVPNLTDLPFGCYFAPRCPKANDLCRQNEPDTFVVSDEHSVKCWLYASKEELPA